MKIRPVGAELFPVYGQTDRRDEANSRFSQFCERAWKYHQIMWPMSADLLVKLYFKKMAGRGFVLRCG